MVYKVLNVALVQPDLKELKEILELQVQLVQHEVKVTGEINAILVILVWEEMRKLDGNCQSMKY